MEHQTSNVQVIPADKAKIMKIWKVAGILAAITIVEFIIAFTVPAGGAKSFVFIALTIWKAFYIVSEFMHLGHEKKSLIMSILLPLLFVIFLIFILMVQGASILEVLH
ncbi:cytochrome C oxidase subunit IV family protein [Marinoscillum pacificum]|uniref:cytochrome C oxidase subunit IV family protein n=1 Tax=Marinoscillum pacificum TaxID=392723 RepID=UPI0021584EAF|nr:cytochrome C oxidase subunit IV family protein [Marinoscillum pacificum]|tara:strand:+ start:150 stop:473 length:324 start_codon:yes stop_codon:yes gene_type:complete